MMSRENSGLSGKDILDGPGAWGKGKLEKKKRGLPTTSKTRETGKVNFVNENISNDKAR